MVQLSSALKTTFCILLLLLELINYGMSQPKPGLRVGQAAVSFGARPPKNRKSAAAINAGTRVRPKPSNSRAVRELTARTWNLNFCGFSLNFRGKSLNRNNLRFTTSEAANVAGLLAGRKLLDTFYVLCRLAHFATLSSRNAGRRNVLPRSFDVEKLNFYQGDIVLDIETVDRVLKPAESSFLRENGRAVPLVLSSPRSFQTVNQPTFRPSGRVNPFLRRLKRKISIISDTYWPSGLVRYFLDSSIDSKTESAIRQAIAEWEQWTCMRFSELNSVDNLFTPHVTFSKLNGCWSSIGMLSSGQTISIGKTCDLSGIVAHEIGHIFGFFHEQSRPDRDNYVQINPQNIQPGFESNFEKQDWDLIKTDGIEYDHSSVMHYAPRDFSVNDEPTNEPLDSYLFSTIGQRESLSFGDIQLANYNYCQNTCGGITLEWNQCQNGGYRNPNNCNECICRKGFSPPFCVNVQQGQNANCGSRDLTATTSVKTLKSPGFEDIGYQANSLCNWRITAPANHLVQLRFVGRFGFENGYLNITCDFSYLEVRRHPEMPGKRFCNKDLPSEVVYSAGQEMTLMFVSGTSSGIGFHVQYKAVPCGGCVSGSGASQRACSRFVYTKVNEAVDSACTGPSCSTTPNTVFEEEKFCCTPAGPRANRCSSIQAATTTPSPTTTTAPPPTTTTPPPTTTTAPPPTTTTTPPPTTTATPTPTTTTTPPPTTTTTLPPTTTTTLPPTTTTTPPPTTTTQPPTSTPNVGVNGWSPWTAFSQCSETCGFCGFQSRFRTCLNGNCPGQYWDARRCPPVACPYIPGTFFSACYYVGFEIWCTPFGSFCYMAVTPSNVFGSAGGQTVPVGPDGTKVVGTLDINTGNIAPLPQERATTNPPRRRGPPPRRGGIGPVNGKR